MALPPSPLLLLLVLAPSSLLRPRPCAAASSSILPGQPLNSTSDALVSSDGTFSLGFFSPSPNTTYLAIWYSGLPTSTAVWVANRDAPVIFPPATLTLSRNSSLLLSDSHGTVRWSSGPVPGAASAVIERLGKLVIYSANSASLWQSSDHPTDSILRSMTLWANRDAGTAASIVSWRTSQDPSSGNFAFGKDPENPFQFAIRRQSDKVKRWRSDVWAGTTYIGVTMGSYIVFLTFTETVPPWSNVTFEFAETSTPLHLLLSPEGRLELRESKPGSANWSLAYSLPASSCDGYGFCGAFGFCDGSADPPSCACPEGFRPRVQADWDAGQFGGGCARVKEVGCAGDFTELNGMKLPDHLVSLGDMDLDSCKEACRKNCSCVAYARAINSTTCLVWMDELIDLGRQGGNGDQVKLLDIRGQTLFLRVAAKHGRGDDPKTTIVIVVSSILGAILFVGLAYMVWKRRKSLREKSKKSREEKKGNENDSSEVAHFVGEGKLELPLVDFEALLAATDNFSDSHKIGQGGFGKVYKGRIFGDEEVAIKRLSKGSGQGLEEFKNEVLVIAQLQHRNLVRLLGCCIKGVEKLLIYEYMPNKSLDFFLFGDLEKQMILSWERRFIIIKGIARGLRYLHEDSRLRIIHRDLKSSNVLLDGDMNPRISDFGMARIFGGDQNQANTVRVAGTYGYMSPEYAMEGNFSVKSDVYSFGVMLLEIVSGQRNSGFRYTDQHYSLLSYAWESWNNGTAVDIIDQSVAEDFSSLEVARCIHIGLLCVQDRTKDRPAMSSVVFMLENDSPIEATPKKPTFTPRKKHGESSTEQGRTPETASINSVTITAVECR